MPGVIVGLEYIRNGERLAGRTSNHADGRKLVAAEMIVQDFERQIADILDPGD
jgi:hypothetical protein